ncbi:gamma-aminobutyric acid receptor subunit beta-3-like [Pollicipes pollicipes]|uniref:gamma-aminobutyric acid receptor subunit beta-3-like n=1 Tax=Pollicipes pollicipes TaxID=41117 RepID=UPI001885A1DD|nr:gamma-aminobutyric acid receptor subunit beta-3-like [Pollicipes pollicipes]
MPHLIRTWIHIVIIIHVCISASGWKHKPEPVTNAICGLRPPKTTERLHCEHLYRENLNLARCPYAFPVYIRGTLEDIEVTHDVRSFQIRLLLDIRWSIVQNRSTSSSFRHSVVGRNDSGIGTNATEDKHKVSPDLGFWIPQLFLASSQPQSLHLDVSRENDVVQSGGVFKVQRRLFSRVWCKNDLWRYPLDSHECVWHIGAFQAQNYSVQLFWDDAVFTTGNLSLTGFDVSVSFQNQTALQYVSIDNRQVSRLPIVVKIRRNRFHAILRVYLPSVCMAVIAWISFYIPDELAEGRVLVTVLNLVGTIQMLRVLHHDPHGGVIKAIDVWMISIIVFIWVSVVACLLDLDLAFRGIEREQQESLDDLVFFYRQPKLARQLADTGHADESSPAAERVEWSDFYQWAHERHAARHQRPDEAELEDDSSQWSVKSLLQNMWDIRKEYRWFTWSDYVSKCVEIMYPVFFCVFLVIYCLVFVPYDESYDADV